MRNKTFYSIIFILTFIAALIIASSHWMQSHFGIATVDSILFHIQFPLTKSPSFYTFSFIKRVIYALCIASSYTISSYFLLKYSNWKKFSFKKIYLSVSVICLFLSLAYIIKTYQIIPFLQHASTDNQFIEEHYFIYDMEKVQFPEKKRNVIVLYMESMENTFYDEALFPKPLLEKLQNMQKNNYSCTLTTCCGMEWTVASLTGFLLGVPLKLPIYGNSYDSVDASFLPGAVSLLELFEKNNYNISLIAGSDVSFAGVRNLFTSHCTAPDIYDLLYFQNVPEIAASLSEMNTDWGMKDKNLYEQAQKLITQFAHQERPFFTIIQTIDTHNPTIAYEGHPKPYGDARDAFIAADHMAADFLNWLSQQDFYQNTTVIVLGDHQYMNEFLGPVHLGTKRQLYNMFLNTVIPGDRHRPDRHATILDMGPSLLQAIGVRAPENRFGLGVSIFSETPTLMERYGITTLSSSLLERSSFYNSFFDKNPLERAPSKLTTRAAAQAAP